VIGSEGRLCVETGSVSAPNTIFSLRLFCNGVGNPSNILRL
jgi:hypothetical protein